MNDPVLLVDDEQNVLDGFRRQLGRTFRLQTAIGGESALTACKTGGPFCVIVSDMQMPGMNGVEFFERVRTVAPDTSRIMLTGNADQRTAVEAVNSGRIFRFLNKPCSIENLGEAIRAGIEQYRLIQAEKELLSKTLVGSIRILSDVLALVNPAAFGRSNRIRSRVKAIGDMMGLRNIWEIEIAAMLGQVGCVAIPPDLLERAVQGESLDESEKQLFDQHPQVGAKLVANIPRLQGVSEIIRLQSTRFDSVQEPNDLRSEDRLAAQILGVITALDSLESSNIQTNVAVSLLQNDVGRFDPAVLETIVNSLDLDVPRDVVEVAVRTLRDGMILMTEITTTDGRLLVGRGQVVTDSMRARLIMHQRRASIREPILVRMN
jgi:response regulator RpfG family c-di-GMP phosphodiesterase